MVYDERRYQIMDKNLNENHKKINKIEENAKKMYFIHTLGIQQILVLHVK